MKQETNIIGRINKHRFHRRGISLVECMFALVILPMAVAAITYALAGGQKQAYAAVQQSRASLLAEALMEEILALPYEDPDGPSNLGPEAGESNRTKFDNADDYHGFTQAANALEHKDGTVYPDYLQTFSRTVACELKSVTAAEFGDPITGLEIKVTIQLDNDTMTELTRFLADPS